MTEDAAITFEAALRTLLAEIAFGNYRDPIGHRLTMNTAYIEAVALLELRDTLAGGTGQDDAG